MCIPQEMEAKKRPTCSENNEIFRKTKRDNAWERILGKGKSLHKFKEAWFLLISIPSSFLGFSSSPWIIYIPNSLVYKELTIDFKRVLKEIQFQFHKNYCLIENS